MRNPIFVSLASAVLLGGAGAASAQDVKVTGGFELGYTFNFNKPVNRSSGYLFNGRDADFTVNRTEFALSQEPSAKSNSGFLLRFVEGNIANALPGLTGATAPNIEAYGIVAGQFAGRDLRIEAGQFRSLFGVEGLAAGDFYSRSYSFQFLQPILGRGARATLRLGERSSLTGIIQNGLSRVEDTNKDLSLGVSLVRPLGEDGTLRVNIAGGRETAAFGVRSVGIANAVYTRTFGDDTKFALDGTVRFGRDAADDSVSTTGIAAYLTKPLGNGGALALRGEYLSAGSATHGLIPNGITPALKPDLASITVAYHLPSSNPNSRTILEYRFDRSNDFRFEKGAASFKKDQATVTLGQVFKF